ncbi:MAG: MFS transporter [Candidatus Parcubacteria bacterium]|nr:MFS transporter [Candidatus Parcubacteria bacterium]
MIIKENIRQEKFHYLYLAIFLYAVCDALFAYAQSTYLNQYVSLQLVGVVFFCAYLLTFFVINFYPRLIARFNNLKMALASIFLRLACLLIFIFFANTWLIVVTFLFFVLSLVLTFTNMDIFLEAFSRNETTGKTRGLYFTIYNLGWLVSPLLAGLILNYYSYGLLFTVSLLLNLPVALILYFKFRKTENHYVGKKFKFIGTLIKILKAPDLRKIFIVSALLQFFYAIEVVYAPIYLNQSVGLDWQQIGIVFTFMLIPFVLIQYPAGVLADKYFGEKEMLFVGMLLMSVTSVIMGLITGQSLLIWAIILFISRIGASLVEIMRETYFFKKVDVADIDIINTFRSTIPLAYLLAPIMAVIILYYYQFNYIFVALGVIMFLGLWPILTLKDTK